MPCLGSALRQHVQQSILASCDSVHNTALTTGMVGLRLCMAVTHLACKFAPSMAGSALATAVTELLHPFLFLIQHCRIATSASAATLHCRAVSSHHVLQFAGPGQAACSSSRGCRACILLGLCLHEPSSRWTMLVGCSSRIINNNVESLTFCLPAASCTSWRHCLASFQPSYMPLGAHDLVLRAVHGAQHFSISCK